MSSEDQTKLELDELRKQMSPEDYAGIEKEVDELVKHWSEHLPDDTLAFWLEVRENEHCAKADACQLEISALKGLMHLIRNYKVPLSQLIGAAIQNTARTPEDEKAISDWVEFARARAKNPTLFKRDTA